MNTNLDEENRIMEKEFIDMAKRCSAEIKDLRRQIDILRPKADAYENLSAVLGLLPKPSQGFSEDLAWRLDKRVEELSKPKEPNDAV